jgi:integrase
MATRTRTTRLQMLSARQVQAAGDGDHADGGGLRLRVTAGRAQWVLRYTSPAGRRREMGLGSASRHNTAAAGDSLGTARRLAHEARELLRTGTDPLDARELHRDAARQADDAHKAAKARQRWTLARCARDYHERVIEKTRTPKHSAQWISSLENHIPPALWRAPIDSIEPPALLTALLGVKPHERARRHKGDTVPETLRRIRQRLDAIFEDAIFHGRASTNPAAAIKRKMRETAPKREVRGQFAALPYKEAPALLQRLREAPGTAARSLELAVLTAARTSEVLLAEWAEFDLDAATWVVPAGHMKAKESHTVYLPARAVEIVKAQAGQDARLVFPSTMPKEGRARPQSNMAMLAVLDRLGVRDQTTVHGLARATFSTWANETGAARPDVIEACLAHAEGNRVRAAYNRSQFADERRALLAAWAQYLQGAQVIPFPQRASS